MPLDESSESIGSVIIPERIGDYPFGNGSPIYKEEEEYNWSPVNFAFIPLVILIIWTFIGNALVLIAVYRERGLKSMSNYVIASLAVADLLLSLLVMPLGLVSLIRGQWGLGLTLCVIYLSLDVMLCTASILHLCAIAVNRFFAVTFPLLFSRDRANSRSRILGTIVPVWVVSFCLTIPLVIQGLINPALTLINNGRDCGYFDRKFIIYSSMGSFYVPLAIMVVVDIGAVKKLRGRRSALKKFSEPTPKTPIQATSSNTPLSEADANGIQSNGGGVVRKKSIRITFNPARRGTNGAGGTGYGSTNVETIQSRQHMIASKRERRAAKTLVLVFVCFIICWLPFFMIHLTSGICTSCDVPVELFIAFTWLGYMSSAVNPCIYTLFNLDFRRAFIRIITCDRRPKRTVRQVESSTVHTTFRSSVRS